MADATAFEQEDREKKEAIEIRNEAEQYLYKAENFYNESKKDMDKEKKKQIKSDMAELKKVIGKTKIETITRRQAQEIKETLEKLRLSTRHEEDRL